MKILLCTDGTKLSNHAIHKAIDFLDFCNRDVYIISVMQNPDYIYMEAGMDTNWYESIQQQQRFLATKAISEAKEHLFKKGITVKGDNIITGTPSEEIINYAKKENIDLIVLGGHSRSGFKEFLLGSVSRRILSETCADVLVIKDTKCELKK